jgi:hypothetical protein
VGKKGEDLRADLGIGKLLQGKRIAGGYGVGLICEPHYITPVSTFGFGRKLGRTSVEERLRSHLLDANCERDKMPHITTAMERSMRRSVVDYALGGLLGKRDIVGEVNSVKNTFSSWDNCMAQSYCKSVSRSPPHLHANLCADGPSSC